MKQHALLAEMEREYKSWKRGTTSYGALCRGFRVFLISASAVVAADTHLSSTPLTFLIPWIPVLAVLVTIVTSIDTWMKPQVRWRGFMDNRDKMLFQWDLHAGDLEIKLSGEERVVVAASGE